MAKQKPKTSTSGTPKRNYFTYWLTRDTIDGVLVPDVRIWLAQPKHYRHRDGRGGYWSSPGREADIYGYWSIEECINTVPSHTYPEDDRQCIRVEGDSVRQPTEHTAEGAAVEVA